MLTGLAARAVIDKLLALSGGAERVAQWAQVQALVDMVIGVISVGLGQGVTVLVAQRAEPAAQRQTLRDALVLGAFIGAAVGALLLTAVVLGRASMAPTAKQALWPHGDGLALLAVLAGAAGIAGVLVNAYWLGRHRQDRVCALAVVLALPAVLAAAGGGDAAAMLWAQALAGAAVTLLVAVWAQRKSTGAAPWRWPPFFARDWTGWPLWRYVPVGLSIGLASPLSLALVRGDVSAALSWHDAGVMQAIWRSAEWVTMLMSGVLALVYLPRFSTDPARLPRRLFAAGWRVIGATALLLGMLWWQQRIVLATLYDARVGAEDGVVGLFLLGELLRVGSWVMLFGLLACRATWWVTLGEFLSLPLFAALVLLSPPGLTLARTGELYLLTYVIYLAFNACGITWTLRVARRKSDASMSAT